VSYRVSAADLTEIHFEEQDIVSDVLQNIAIILSTPKGSVPLDREFGLSTVFLDKPIPVAKTMLIAEIREAIERWEPRAQFIGVIFEEKAAMPGTLWPTVEVEIIGEQRD